MRHWCETNSDEMAGFAVWVKNQRMPYEWQMSILVLGVISHTYVISNFTLHNLTLKSKFQKMTKERC